MSVSDLLHLHVVATVAGGGEGKEGGKEGSVDLDVDPDLDPRGAVETSYPSILTCPGPPPVPLWRRGRGSGERYLGARADGDARSR